VQTEPPRELAYVEPARGGAQLVDELPSVRVGKRSADGGL
jgi:hypothetical protein